MCQLRSLSQLYSNASWPSWPGNTPPSGAEREHRLPSVCSRSQVNQANRAGKESLPEMNHEGSPRSITGIMTTVH